VKASGIIKNITMHTYATLLLTAGVDLFTVSNLLGYKDYKGNEGIRKDY
jgi:site-specific recombinase XerD